MHNRACQDIQGNEEKEEGKDGEKRRIRRRGAEGKEEW
jgi:hypothetical protein